MPYTYAYIFTKRTNLLPWLESQHYFNVSDATRSHYEKEREVQLILLVRHESKRTPQGTTNRRFCKIKCPINPLPIKGEFEVVSVAEICKLLRSLGWVPKAEYSLRMFE